MLIKGVTGGKERGNPIEFSAEEKFPLAIAKFLQGAAPEGKMFLYSNKLTLDQKQSHPLDVPNGKGFANSAYAATGKVWYKVLDVKNDKLYPEKVSDFSIKFHDGPDELGMPDLKLDSFELT